jgi:hypothetical protein
MSLELAWNANFLSLSSFAKVAVNAKNFYKVFNAFNDRKAYAETLF